MEPNQRRIDISLFVWVQREDCLRQGVLSLFLGFFLFFKLLSPAIFIRGECSGNVHPCFNAVKLLHCSSDIIPLQNLSFYLLPSVTHFRSFSLSFSDFRLDFFPLSRSPLLFFALNLLLLLFTSSIRILSSATSFSLVHTLLRSHIFSSSPSCSPLSSILLLLLSLPFILALISRRFLNLPFLAFCLLRLPLSLSLSLSLMLPFNRSLTHAIARNLNFSLWFLSIDR